MAEDYVLTGPVWFISRSPSPRGTVGQVAESLYTDLARFPGNGERLMPVFTDVTRAHLYLEKIGHTEFTPYSYRMIRHMFEMLRLWAAAGLDTVGINVLEDDDEYYCSLAEFIAIAGRDLAPHF